MQIENRAAEDRNDRVEIVCGSGATMMQPGLTAALVA